MSPSLRIVGGGFPGLARAVEETRRGAHVEYVEPQLRAGGTMVTESFLSPFRFNLGPALVPRPPVPSLSVLEPQMLLDVAGATVTRVAALSGGAAPLSAALAVLLGIDPGSSDADARLADACRGEDDLVLVAGGNGLAVACLVDELVAAGSTVVEGVGGVDGSTAPGEGLGICRLFVGRRGAAPPSRAFATAVGFQDDRSLHDRLASLRAGDVDEPVGFILSNAHLDANVVDGDLSSLVWQGVLPFGAGVSREDYTARVLAAVGIEQATVVFRLLWLPEDTGEALR